MHLTIGSILSAESLAEARALMDQLRWSDGAKTAGPTARRVKRNRQADLSSNTGARLKTLLESALAAHVTFNAATRPKRFSKLLVTETSDGGEYGAHVDNPFMGRGEARIRTDVSFTLFLSDPDSYEGGELVIDQAGATQSVKGQAGDVFVYPSTYLHAVSPVTSGVRRVCVGWIESDIPDAGDRELLFDLENLHASLSRQHTPHSPEMLTVTKLFANLSRRLSR
ncbi:Fe2+-dependent dioxygenase [Oceanicaulis sp.]|uniref:Fe2+-dependent dioxygenase n=1 Tax=Oceanicaulis sp. TaxID=1924941 RepID=UPI003D2A7E92